MRILTALIIALLAIPAARAQPKGEDRVVIAVFGGLLGKQIAANVQAYTKPLGIEAVFVESASADILAKIRAQKNNPQFDLALLNDQTFVIARSLGLLAKLDPKEVPNLAEMRDGFRDPQGYGQAFEINPVGYAYRRDKYTAAGIPAPNTWQAVLDPRVKGRNLTFTLANFYTLLQFTGFAVSQGKTVRDDAAIWPLVERLHANDTVVVPAPGQAEQLAQRGDIWMYPATAQRAYLLAQQTPEIAFAPAADVLLSLTNFIAPVARAPHPVNAQRVLNWMIGREIQTRMANDGAVVPVNATVELTPALKQRGGFDPNKPLPIFQKIDVEAVNDLMDPWSERFDKIMAR